MRWVVQYTFRGLFCLILRLMFRLINFVSFSPVSLVRDYCLLIAIYPTRIDLVNCPCYKDHNPIRSIMIFLINLVQQYIIQLSFILSNRYYALSTPFSQFSCIFALLLFRFILYVFGYLCLYICFYMFLYLFLILLTQKFSRMITCATRPQSWYRIEYSEL